jgi:hypothetical protein
MSIPIFGYQGSRQWMMMMMMMMMMMLLLMMMMMILPLMLLPPQILPHDPSTDHLVVGVDRAHGEAGLDEGVHQGGVGAQLGLDPRGLHLTEDLPRPLRLTALRARLHEKPRYQGRENTVRILKSVQRPKSSYFDR